MTDRRQFLVRASIVPLFAAGSASLAPLALADTLKPEDFTQLDFTGMQVAMNRLYDLDRSVVNLDAAYYGAMPRPIHAAYLEKVSWVNRYNSTFLRSAVPGHPRDPELDLARDAVASLVGARPDEIALAGGGTEALYALIANYAPLKAGESIIMADVDYDEMQFAMDWLAKSRGASVVRFSVPEPHTRANVLAAYEKVLKDTPRARLLLLTHVSNRNGLIPPVAEICTMAKAQGIDVILDSAQAVGQMPFDVTRTGADFIGFSLHKWIAAPLGTGAIYVKRERQGDILPWLGDHIHTDGDIRARLPTGTVDFAARLTIPAAIALQQQIGIQRRFAHLRALRDYWYTRAAEIPGVELMLPTETADYGAISAFRFRGMTTDAATRQAQARLLEKHGVLVVAKGGLASGAGLRVTPAPFTTTVDLDRLLAAMAAERAMFS